jgi:hypothetical protein
MSDLLSISTHASVRSIKNRRRLWVGGPSTPVPVLQPSWLEKINLRWRFLAAYWLGSVVSALSLENILKSPSEVPMPR